MKNPIATLSAAALLALIALAASPAADAAALPGATVTLVGVVTKTDAKAMSLTIKDDAGKRHVVFAGPTSELTIKFKLKITWSFKSLNGQRVKVVAQRDGTKLNLMSILGNLR